MALWTPGTSFWGEAVVSFVIPGSCHGPRLLLLQLPDANEDQHGQDEAGEVVWLETEGQLDCSVGLGQLAVGGRQVEAEIELSQVISGVQL